MTDHRKTLALLAVVAASGPDGIGRERLMALLWPESDATHARGSLKQMLHFIRKLLDSRDMIFGITQIAIDQSILSSDVSLFRDALSRGDDLGAIATYTGPFLDGVHIDAADELERWSAEERDRLARLFAEALERLATKASKENRDAEAVELWSRLQSLDALNGRYALGLVKALDASGEAGRALRYARSYETLLRDELGTTPDKAFAALVNKLRSRAPQQSVAADDSGVANESDADYLVEQANVAHRLVSPGTAAAKLHLDEARAYYTRALALDPVNARGLCGFGNWHYVMGISGYAPREESFAKGRELIFAALSADDSIAEVHCSLAKMALYVDDDFNAALRFIRRSLELDPYDPEALRILSVVSKILGHSDESVNAANAAVQRDPKIPGLWNGLGDALMCAGRNEEAIDALRRAIRLRPDYGLALERLERAYIGMEDFDNAVEIRKSRLRIAHDRKRAGQLIEEKKSLGSAEALRRDTARELEDLIAHAEQTDPFEQYFTTRTTADRIVTAYADLKQWTNAMDWVELAYERRPGRVRRMLTDLPIDRKGLATDSRYVTIMTMAGAEDLIQPELTAPVRRVSKRTEQQGNVVVRRG